MGPIIHYSYLLRRGWIGGLWNMKKLLPKVSGSRTETEKNLGGSGGMASVEPCPSAGSDEWQAIPVKHGTN
ncbi:hypothetical protein GE21DRAFT_1251360 [Neurospora crassa]|nr:hypothetical protein GE21DRAFT_1251360 [Neurospora crassa]